MALGNRSGYLVFTNGRGEVMNGRRNEKLKIENEKC
jgi:hypothetical protein